VTAAAGAGGRGQGTTTRRKGEVMAAAAAGGQRGIFGMDQERAAQALALTWGELYQDTGWQTAGGRPAPARQETR